MKTEPKALYIHILEARDRQDVGFNITGKLSEKIHRGKPGQTAKRVCGILSASSDTNCRAVSVWKATLNNLTLVIPMCIWTNKCESNSV
jgi:hypothetical protein